MSFFLFIHLNSLIIAINTLLFFYADYDYFSSPSGLF